MAVGDLSIVLVYVLVVLLEIIEVFYQAAESAILPEIISKDLLNEAMSRSKLDDGMVYVATSAIGTVMYKLFGVQGGLWTTTAFFFLSFLFHFGIRTPHYIRSAHGSFAAVCQFCGGGFGNFYLLSPLSPCVSIRVSRKFCK